MPIEYYEENETPEKDDSFPDFPADAVLTSPDDIRRGILQLLRQDGIRLVRETRRPVH